MSIANLTLCYLWWNFLLIQSAIQSAVAKLFNYCMQESKTDINHHSYTVRKALLLGRLSSSSIPSQTTVVANLIFAPLPLSHAVKLIASSLV